MDWELIYLVTASVFAVLLAGTLVSLFWVSRRTQRVMESVLEIITRPGRAKVGDAARVFRTIMSDEITTIETLFKSMSDSLQGHIAAAEELKKSIKIQNEKLVGMADASVKQLSVMTQRLDNTVTGLNSVVMSNDWADALGAAERFSDTINMTLAKVDTTTQDTTEKISAIHNQIDSWISSSDVLGQHLKSAFETNENQMKELTAQSDVLRNQMETLNQSTASGFANVQSSATDYKSLMEQNNRLLTDQVNNMERLKRQLSAQVNALTNTSNLVGGQIRLAESSINKQDEKIQEIVTALINSGAATENAVRGISTELTGLTNRFNSEIKEFAADVVNELKNVSGTANVTLENTRKSAGAFSESVRAMATGVRETLIKMNEAHTQLTGQSQGLIKMSEETTAKLQPLSELIERYYATLPGVAHDSNEIAQNMERNITSLNEKIDSMKRSVSESAITVGESSAKLEDLAGQSRQQMIDLMSDYAKAVETMQTLNKQMMVARAAAPMDAIRTVPVPQTFGATISSTDFLKQCERMFDKMHDQSYDLVMATGVSAKVPDMVWKKYHAGDKTVFSQWVAKVLANTDKKQLQSLLKNNSVFHSQATQFVRGFEKILAGAKKTENSDNLIVDILQKDLGKIYTSLKGNV
ncbi:MAG: hypothetical protein MJ187_01495 [Alphaproteobacteria bacterium]|nr:hypothetical protein [Alphaproteobacteria bacterium]